MAAIKTIGKATALTAITRIKEGHADALRAALTRLTEAGGGKIAGLGTIYAVRWVIFDGDTRLLFATNFSGDVEDYMRDFAEKAPEGIDAIWGHCEGYPGAANYKELRDYILGSAIETTGYYNAFQDVTVKEARQAIEWKRKFDEFQDSL
jgi:hypothetical protein